MSDILHQAPAVEGADRLQALVVSNQAGAAVLT
jgi:hypothetical protein